MHRHLYRNNTDKNTKSNYLRLELKDPQHKSVMGTRVTIYSNGKSQMSEATNARGIYSTSESQLHFGLGANTVDSLVVVWPNNKRHILKNVAVNKTLSLSPENAKDLVEITNVPRPIFEEVSINSLQITHRENNFDDYEKQVLLPHKMSQFGPALAVADVNSDGLEDLYIGGASGIPAQILIQDKKGQFSPSNTTLLDKEKPYEDVDALFVDLNGDAALDLYVVSGGNEYPSNDFHYSDRVYLNDGRGNFTKGAIMGLARTSGSVVKAEDVDADGDMDLFVAGRHVPHQYPSPATSMLLINEGGQLVNKTESFAPEFKHLGMVTDALWTDYDADGDPDLMLSGEWMPLTIFNNQNGLLSKATIPSFENTAGWWFSLASADIDGDGDPDYLAGNLGLNYKYKTSPEKPFDVYYNDFDGNNKYDIVLGYYTKTNISH